MPLSADTLNEKRKKGRDSRYVFVERNRFDEFEEGQKEEGKRRLKARRKRKRGKEVDR